MSNDNPISVGNRTVAIFDILGVKDDILAGKSADLVRRYRDRIQQTEALRNFEYPDPAIPRLFPLGLRARLRPSLHIFSDTLILISPDDTLESTSLVLIESWRLLQSFITGRLPLRGGIWHGEMHIDSTNRLHVGPALSEAHLLEASQAWAGCVVDQTVIDRLPNDPWEHLGFPNLFARLIPSYEVPFKSGNEITYSERRVLNWRCNLVFDRGLCADFVEAHGVGGFDDLHPYLKRALSFGREHKRYLEPATEIPVECRVHWVGKTEPPFPNGDDY